MILLVEVFDTTWGQSIYVKLEPKIILAGHNYEDKSPNKHLDKYWRTLKSSAFINSFQPGPRFRSLSISYLKASLKGLIAASKAAPGPSLPCLRNL